MADSKTTGLAELDLTLDDLFYFVDMGSSPVQSGKISATRALGFALRHLCQFRLTLAPGNPVYVPLPSTPVSTDTSAETCTFTLPHGWESGTIVTVSATIGGLTAGTRYYLNKVSMTAVSFHTTVADALAGTNKVNLTASITSVIIPSGISRTSLKASPFNGNGIGLYDGTRWVLRHFSEIDIPLGTVTAGIGYDVWAYDNAGTVAFEILAWASASVRATDWVLQDGVKVKTGALTRRLMGSFETDTTTTTIDDAGGISSQVGAKRFVSNLYNRRPAAMRHFDGTSTWTYSTATWRQGNGAAGNKLEFFSCLNGEVQAALFASAATSVNSAAGLCGINLDSITAQPPHAVQVFLPNGGAPLTGALHADVGPGHHYVAWMESGNGTATVTWYGTAAMKSGLSGSVLC